MIEINGLSKAFGAKKILSNINIHFASHHIYGLVGENGSGKTTLMRCICGLIRPDEGYVSVLGKRIGKDCDFSPSTGVIIETPGFLPYYSGLKNLQCLLRISRYKKPDAAKSAMRKVGLDPDDARPVKHYSLGMRQRLGIAQALMEEPSILILDEPFNGLDAQSNDVIHRLLQEQKEAGKCIILASHSRHDISVACDTLCLIQDGHVARSSGVLTSF